MRGTKFYRKNETQVMEDLGFKPTKNSGAGWIEKEDGINDTHICQLKSTDAMSISIKQNDLHILENNAAVSHKEPVFAFQFLNTGEVWVAIRKMEYKRFMNVLEYIEQICDKESKVEDVSRKKHIDNIKTTNYDIDKARKNLSCRNKVNEQRQREKEEQNKEYQKRRKESIKEWKRNSTKKE